MELFQLNFHLFLDWMQVQRNQKLANIFIYPGDGTYPFHALLNIFGYFFEIEKHIKSKQTNKQKMKYRKWLLHSSNFISLLNSLQYHFTSLFTFLNEIMGVIEVN